MIKNKQHDNDHIAIDCSPVLEKDSTMSADLEKKKKKRKNNNDDEASWRPEPVVSMNSMSNTCGGIHHPRRTSSATTSSITSSRKKTTNKMSTISLSNLLLEYVVSDNAEVATNAVEELASRCEDEDFCKQVYSKAGHGIIMVILNKWNSNATIQGWCCVCLHNIVSRVDGAKRALTQLGVMPALVSTMQRHITNAEVQIDILGAIGNLLATNDAFTRELTRIFILQLHGIAVIVDVMKKFSTNKEVIIWAIWTLSCVAECVTTESNLKRTMILQGAISSSAIAFENFPDNHDIQNHATEVMKFLTKKIDKDDK